MSTLPTSPPRRQRKPLQPVRVTGQLYTGLGMRLAELLQGSAILTITDADGDALLYWSKALTSGGRIVGVELTKFATAETRHVHLAPDGAAVCDCEDATYRPDRPGGCKHVVALTMALTAATEGRP